MVLSKESANDLLEFNRFSTMSYFSVVSMF